MIDPAAYKIYEALEKTGWSGDRAALDAALKKLNQGLPSQDEFCMIASWLGRCRLIHELNQRQYPPQSITEYRVPDLLAVFEIDSGPVAVLIEVKATAGAKLSWRPDYYEALARYGRMLGLPVLVAWKERRVGTWALVDLSTFVKSSQNYVLGFGTAMKNSLMGLLAGDFLIHFTAGFGLHLHFRKLSPIVDNRIPCVIDEAFFLGPEGQRFTTLKGGLWPFFLTLDVHIELKETETHFYQSYVVKEGHGSQFAHRGFPALFPTEKPKRWRRLLEEHSFKVLPEDLRMAAREAAEHSATSGLMRVLPQTTPPYLKMAREYVTSS